MGMLASYWYYIFTFTISILFSGLYGRIAKKNVHISTKVLFAILIILPVVILQGFRYDVGTDYFNYASLSEGFAEGKRIYYQWYIREPLFLQLSKISYNIGGKDPYFFFLLDAVIMNVLLFCIADYYKDQMNLPTFYMLYYSSLFSYFLNIERQGIAVLIILYSFRFIDNNKTIRFFICLAIAMLIHNTAVIGVVFYLFRLLQKTKLPDNIIKWLLIIALLFSPAIVSISLQFISRYSFFDKYVGLKNAKVDSNINTNLLFALTMAMIIVVGYRKQYNKIGDRSWWLFLYACQIISYLLNAYLPTGVRLSFYFQFGIFYVYGAVQKLVKRRENKLLFYIIVIILALFHFTYKFYIQGNSEIFPYKFIWSR